MSELQKMKMDVRDFKGSIQVLERSYLVWGQGAAWLVLV